MALKFNPLSFLGLDIDSTGAGAAFYLPPVANPGDLPITDQDGSARTVISTNSIFVFNQATSKWHDTGLDLGSLQATSTPNGLSILPVLTGDVYTYELRQHAADATNPGALTAVAQTIAGVKTFNDVIYANGNIDKSGAGTLSIGSLNATTINIGNASAVVNFNGTVNNNNVTNLNVTDQLITINDGGGAGSASGAGLEIEENAVITGYIKTSGDRNSYLLKAPNTAGDITLTPGAAGFSITQGSHDPVTLGTANGLSLSTQALSLALSSTSTTGALSDTDWNTFNSKQAAGSYALTTSSLAQFAATSSLELKTLISDETGSDALVFANTPTLVTPVLGVASATSINKVSITAPATGSTLTIADGFTLTVPANASVSGTNTGDQDASGVSNTPSGNLVATTVQAALNELQLELDGAATSTALSNHLNDTVDAHDASAISNVPAGSIVATNVQAAINELEGDLANKANRYTGDIDETSTSSSVDVVTNESIPNLVFNGAFVGGFSALVRIKIIGGTDTFAIYEIHGVRRTADWVISTVSIGDEQNTTFSITNLGQIQYSTLTHPGFVQRSIRYRATTVGN